MTTSCIPDSCVPCKGIRASLNDFDIQTLLSEIPHWKLSPGSKKISRDYSCYDFRHSMRILNAIAEIADRQGHHPDFALTVYRKLRISFTTHATNGLTMNDFTMAKLIDKIFEDTG